MIKYIKNNHKGSTIYQTTENIQTSFFNLTIIKKICIKNLFTYEGFIYAYQKNFGSKTLIPIYINQNNQFFPIQKVKDYDNIWINAAAISNVLNNQNQVIVNFIDDSSLILTQKFSKIERQLKILKNLEKHIMKRFHSHFY